MKEKEHERSDGQQLIKLQMTLQDDILVKLDFVQSCVVSFNV